VQELLANFLSILSYNMYTGNIDPEAIAAAERLIRPRIRRTPVVQVDGTDLGLNLSSLTLKLELLQHTGSFKTRGAFVNLLRRELPAAGVAAASGGNHGAAVAFAAQKLGVPATIFVPSVASQSKIDRIRRYGANLIIAGDRYADALTASQAWIIESGALPIHAYNDRETILGQGSVGLELEQQDPNLDTLLVAVGGGGLIGGIAAWYRGRVQIIGVEPETAPTLTAALAAGYPVEAQASGIAADSLAPKCVGELMFPIAQSFVKRVVLVPDQEIQRAQEILWDVLRVAAEPGGAAALSALLSRRYEPQPGERCGVLVCGGNTSAVCFSAA
jgi:threonine dehydratase